MLLPARGDRHPVVTLLTGRRPERPDLRRPWRVWDLDSELRYVPVARALPALDLPVCEVGSGPQGLAVWTDRHVIGVDPGDDGRHGGREGSSPPNLRRVPGDGAHIPLPDRSVAAAVAVDTLEHIPRDERPAVVREMQRVTAPGGRVILMGPSGPAAAAADRELLERHRARGEQQGPVVWLGEHVEHGLPSVEDMVAMLGGERCTRIVVRGVFNLAMWKTMHRALLGDYPQPRGAHLVHHLTWAPFGAAARRLRRGPFYRCLVIADLGP
jgi:SAM-dependent methyltransferase